jgi:hypothetical protein
MVIGRTQQLEKAVRVISGYWNVYLGFFGDQLVWLHFQVTDTRTGRVVWRNGRYTNTTGGFDGIDQQDQGPAAGSGRGGAVGGPPDRR